MSSLVPRYPPSFRSLTVCTANDGKVDRAWGTRPLISDSANELTCVHMRQAVQASSQ